MNRTSRALMAVLAAAVCFGSGNAIATEQVKAHGALSDLIGFSGASFDTGWLGPSNILGYYIQARLSAGFNGELLRLSSVRGSAKLYYPDSPSLGHLGYQGSEGTASFDIGAEFLPLWRAGGPLIGNHSGSMPLLPNWDFRLEDSRGFTPYLVGTSTTLSDSFDDVTIVEYGPNVGIASATIALVLGADGNMRISGRGVTSSEPRFTGSPVSCSVSGSSKTVSSIAMRHDAQPSLVLAPSGNLRLSIIWVVNIDFPIVKFHVLVPLPTFADRGTSTATVAFGLPNISTSVSSIEFDDVIVGQSNDKTFSIGNTTGQATLNVTEITESSTHFSFVSPSPPFAVSQGNSRPAAVRFSPKSAGRHCTILYIYSDDPDTPGKPVTLCGNGVLPTISLSPTSLNPSCQEGTNATSDTFQVWNSGNGTLSYTISETVDWLSVTPSSGTSAGSADKKTHTVSYTTSGLPAKTYHGEITISDPSASNNPQKIPVTLTVILPGDVNSDCAVNILDLIFIRNRLRQDPSSGDNWKADANRDGEINILDLIFVRNQLGTKCAE